LSLPSSHFARRFEGGQPQKGKGNLIHFVLVLVHPVRLRLQRHADYRVEAPPAGANARQLKDWARFRPSTSIPSSCFAHHPGFWIKYSDCGNMSVAARVGTVPA
jgi:hypothetical protein